MMTDDNETATLRVIGGVDTHKDLHVVAALDELGRLLATATFTTTAIGYRDLYRWLRSHGDVVAVGSREPVRGARACHVISGAGA